jgi:PAS domain S-box-containing protein
VIFEDITEKKQVEQALRRSEENFRHSLENSPLGVRIVSEEGETLYINRAILDIYGYDSIEEFNTTPIRKRYTPESNAEFQIRREKRKQGDYVPSEYTVSIVRKNGEVRHLQVFRKEILWDGGRQFETIYQDITEHKRMEEEVNWRNKELAALNAIMATASSSLNLRRVLDQTLDKVLEVVELETGSMYLLDQQIGEMVLAIYRGVPKEFADEVSSFKLGESLVGRVAQSGQPSPSICTTMWEAIWPV